MKRASVFLPLAGLLLALPVAAQTGPDVIVGDLTGPASYGSQSGIAAFAIGTTSCNVGTAPLLWIANTNQHPVIAQNVYRWHNGRMEQIGMSWLKHGFTALQQSLCGGCNPNPNGSALGVGCSDPYSAGLNGNQGPLGPRSEVNASTGFFPYPPNLQPPVGSSIIARRVQVKESDILSGARYFAEGQYVSPDDAQAGNKNNNASYREATISGNPGNYTMQWAGGTVRQKGAIHAWKAIEPQVQIVDVDIPGDGRVTIALKATNVGGGFHRYDYAVHNLSSHRSVRGISIALPSGTSVQSPGFHDVDYHSGEPYSLTDWQFSSASNGVSWATQTFSQNQNANALRWGTMYNFWFESDQQPGDITLELFRPGTPATVTVPAPTIPAEAWQVNQPGAHLDIDGLTNNPFVGPIVANKVIGSAGTVNYSSTAAGNPFDILVVQGPAVWANIWTPTGQKSNINFFDPSLFFAFGFFNALMPAGPQQIPFASPTVPATISLQMVVADPTSADGFWLSAAWELRTATCATSSINHPLGDDASVQVALGIGNDHECVNSIPFYGTSYTDLFINSNGFVSFGSGSDDFTASVSEFANGMPRLAGLWTDLSPNAAGFVNSTDTSAGVLTVTFNQVPEYSAFGVSSVRHTFDMVFDTAAGTCAIQNYTPGSGHSTDSIVGITPGGGATTNSVLWSSLVNVGPNFNLPNRAVYQMVVNGAPTGFSSITFNNSDSSVYIVQ